MVQIYSTVAIFKMRGRLGGRHKQEAKPGGRGPMRGQLICPFQCCVSHNHTPDAREGLNSLMELITTNKHIVNPANWMIVGKLT